MYFTKRILALALAVLLVIPCAFAVSAVAEDEHTLGATAACSGHTLGTFSGVPACVNANGDLHICGNNFPDDNFRNYVSGSDFNVDGDGYFIASEIENVKRISCKNLFVDSLQGIEFFHNLTELSCFENQLTTLNVSKNVKLTSLRCSNNQLTSLDVSNNTALSELSCRGNQLTSLDVSNNAALSVLDCGGNQLTSLDVSKHDKLTGLYCYNNQLTSLDVSNNVKLEYLWCQNNQLTSLDVSNNVKLEDLSCVFIQLTSLDVSNNAELSKLSCGSNPLTSLDVSNNVKLTYLSCDNNQLTSLDVSNNAALSSLSCFGNQLTSLDVSKNVKLTRLDCDSNKLTSLDVSKNVKLTGLYCGYNQLTSLDVSNNVKLEYLSCSDNQLTSLDVSNNASLSGLSCGDNQLTSLDVSNNTALTTLYCDDNQLTSLDVSKNVELVRLICYNNQFATLDVSKNTKLTELRCSGNQLKMLDVSKNASLTNLICGSQKVKTDKSSAKYFDMHDLIPEECLSKVSIDSDTGTYNPETGMIVFNSERENFKYYYDTGKEGGAMDVTVYFQLHEHNAYGDYISNGDGTHTRRCTVEGCNASETENCSGGTATCKDKAICELCGEAYGNLDPENHTGGTHLEHEKAATCTEKGYTGDTYCNGCNEKIADGSEIPTKPHTPGEKWVIENGKKVKKCTECGAIAETAPRMPGDVDGDGEITMLDCLYLKRYILGTFSGEIVLENADVDGNGRIDATDYLYLKRGYLGTFDLSKFA